MLHTQLKYYVQTKWHGLNFKTENSPYPSRGSSHATPSDKKLRYTVSNLLALDDATYSTIDCCCKFGILRNRFLLAALRKMAASMLHLFALSNGCYQFNGRIVFMNTFFASRSYGTDLLAQLQLCCVNRIILIRDVHIESLRRRLTLNSVRLIRWSRLQIAIEVNSWLLV